MKKNEPVMTVEDNEHGGVIVSVKPKREIKKKARYQIQEYNMDNEIGTVNYSNFKDALESINRTALEGKVYRIVRILWQGGKETTTVTKTKLVEK